MNKWKVMRAIMSTHFSTDAAILKAGVNISIFHKDTEAQRSKLTCLRPQSW